MGTIWPSFEIGEAVQTLLCHSGFTLLSICGEPWATSSPIIHLPACGPPPPLQSTPTWRKQSQHRRRPAWMRRGHWAGLKGNRCWMDTQWADNLVPAARTLGGFALLHSQMMHQGVLCGYMCLFMYCNLLVIFDSLRLLRWWLSEIRLQP